MNKVLGAKLLAESGHYFDPEVADYIDSIILGGCNPRAQRLLTELDMIPVGDGPAYEDATFASLKECLGEIVDQERARQHVYVEGSYCDFELPWCWSRLYRHPYWVPLWEKCRIRSILGEVKNTSGPATTADVGQLKQYLDAARTGGFGLLISRNGFSKNARKLLRSHTLASPQLLILPLEHSDLKILLEKSLQSARQVADYLCGKEIELLQRA